MSMSTNKPDAETHYSCKEIAKERDQLRLEYITSVGETQSALEQRDTYRDLCGELLEHLKRAYYAPSVKIDEPLEAAIAKAESILGEK